MPHRDFDAARRGRQPLSFTINGKPRLLPGSPPAKKVLAFLSYDRGAAPDAHSANREAERLMWDLFGGEIEKLIAEDGVEFADIQDLVTWALGQWNLGPGLPEDQPPEVRLQVVVDQLHTLTGQALELMAQTGAEPAAVESLRALHELVWPNGTAPAPSDGVPKSALATSSSTGSP
jgi:hypothetical protein